VFRHSRGIPRLINTICENALLSGYAKDAATITPDIIDGVARDLRLGVVALEQRNNADVRLSEDLEQRELLLAVKTLLEVRERLQGSGTKGRLQ
jgi:general secretion pathway protein A